MAKYKNLYGQTPWGKWFIDVLNSYAMGARLDRGRLYANTGRVYKLEIKDGEVKARVKGSYQPFYNVTISFPPLKEKKRVLKIIEEDFAIQAQIADGLLPQELLEKLQDEGIDLIPKRWSQMLRHCECPDYGDPCKHQAAVYYMLAKEIDADPRVIFTLRGIDLTSKFGTTLDHKITAPFLIESEKPCARIIPEEPPKLPAVPSCMNLILSLLPQTPFFGKNDFSVALAEFYHHAARCCATMEDANNEQTEFSASHSHWSLLALGENALGPGTELYCVQENPQGKITKHTVYETFRQFSTFESGEGTAEYKFLFYLFRFLNTLIAASAFVPCVVYLKTSSIRVFWKAFDGLLSIKNTLEKIGEYEPGMLEIAGKTKRSTKVVKGLSVVKLLSCALLSEWVKRNYIASNRNDIRALFFQGLALDITSPAYRTLPLSIDRWLSVLSVDWNAWKYRITLFEDINPFEEVVESYNFLMTMEVLLPRTDGSVLRTLLKDAANVTGKIEVLKVPNALAHYLPAIGQLLTKKNVALDQDQLVDFLDNAADLVSRLGIEVLFPKNISRELKPRLVLNTDTKKQGGGLLSYMSLDEILEWRWEVAIGDEILTKDEFEKLLKEKRALVKFHDKFIRLDAEELARLFKQTKQAPVAPHDFLREHFIGNSVLSVDAEKVIEDLLQEKEFKVPDSLNAVLREYQVRGYQWICSLLFMGFGAILADDMGLGKTIQAISVLLHLQEEKLLDDKALVIAPAALLENWRRELAHFAPTLRVSIYHGLKRKLDEADVFLTTYQTAVRDAEKLFELTFSILVIDEAHLLKNADTRGSKTVKTLQAHYKLALSGTPVENRLEDMRSLFDFILPGYLGNPAQFKQNFRYPIEVLRDTEKAKELRLITAPFLLRRLKTDKSIIADLPDKIVKNEYAILTKQQLALYETIVSETLKKSEAMEKNAQDPKPQRHFLILGLLTSLKQICDHPRIYDKESAPLSKLSGKSQLLMELLDEIRRNNEKTIIFSQYVETLDCLSAMILNELGERPLVYHGGQSQILRKKNIDSFQSEDTCKILLVSLKAGGLGLNLTAASRVIHYDLWYNPAVENQATDRAFRIGQKRNVFVHRFITKNSFEEKIEVMLSDKRELADLTVGAGESWLANMSHDELRSLFDR